jgi:lipopolysaccharide biosynthesis protein
MISVFFHNYYGQHQQWLRFFAEKMKTPFYLFYNIVEDSIHNIQDDYHQLLSLRDSGDLPRMKDLVIRLSPNKGKDIGGKLVLMDSLLRLETDVEMILFLHDKKSPHAVHNRAWQQKLFRIAEPDFASRASTAFEADAKLGIIAPEESIQDEFDSGTQQFIGNNAAQIARLRRQYDITNADFRHVAGTMFWVRAQPLTNFFSQHPPLSIRRSLEPGNVLDESYGTQTHAWERMLSWVVTQQGFQLKGLP